MNTIKANKNILIAVAALIVVIGLWLFFRNPEPQIQIFDSRKAIEQQEANDRSVGIEEYIKRNISGLSAEAGYPEKVGGTFQATSFQASAGKGTVSYEDGHNAYTADFTYSIDAKGLVSVKTFTVRK